MIKEIVNFFTKNQDKIVLVIGIILIAGISFGFGRLSVLYKSPEPIFVEKEENISGNLAQKTKIDEQSLEQKQNNELDEQKIETNTSGKYLGSKSSNKYHLPNCSYAKKIKRENQIWFNSVKEAQDAGYQPCSVCRPPEKEE